MSMRKVLTIIIVAVVALILLGSIAKNRRERDSTISTTGEPSPVQAASIPNKFQNTYEELDAYLTKFSEYLDENPRNSNSDVTFATELITANGNRGEELLSENGYIGNTMYLDQLEALGVEGVTIFMPFPILTDGYDRSDEYWDFYKRLGAEIKGRNLKLLIKVGPVFREKEISSLGVDYTNTSIDEYFAGKQRIAERVVDEIGPHYLTLANEPATEKAVLGKNVSEARIIQYINETVESIGSTNTLIGAGSGTWEPTSFIQNLSENTSLDYIDLHIYPLASTNADYLVRAAEMAEIAKANNKRVIIGEFWLYKSAARELTSVPTHVEMFGRDTFSFWAPLDQKMLETMTKFAEHSDIEFISPFWSKYLFAYVDYDRNWYRSPGALLRLADGEAVKNLLAKRFSVTGEAYRRIIAENN